MITNNRGVITALFGVGILGASYLLQSSMPSNKKIRSKVKKAKTRERQRIDEDLSLLLRRFKSGKSEGCVHGFHPSESTNLSLIHNFLETVMEVICVCRRKDERTGVAYDTARKNTKEKYPSVYEDAATLDLLSHALLCVGTELLLDKRAGTKTRSQLEIKYKNQYSCQVILAFAEYLSQCIEVHANATKPCFYYHKTNELLCSDERRMLSYTRKRIKCTCLDARFLQVHLDKKMSVCDNVKCSNQDWKRGNVVELKALMRCSRCRKAHYCSKKCQADDYDEHKTECGAWETWIKLKKNEKKHQKLLEHVKFLEKESASKPHDVIVDN